MDHNCMFLQRSDQLLATQGLELASYLVSPGAFTGYLHLCSSVYTHSHST